MLFLESCSALESLHEMLVQEQAVSLCVGAVRSLGSHTGALCAAFNVFGSLAVRDRPCSVRREGG